MSKMTLKECLTICRDMWRWVETTGLPKGKMKLEWPGLVHNGGTIPMPIYGCAACEYTRQHSTNEKSVRTHHRDCTICPLLKLWTGSDESRLCNDAPCATLPDSPYYIFEQIHIEERNLDECFTEMTAGAKKIADFCEKKLEESNEEGLHNIGKEAVPSGPETVHPVGPGEAREGT